MSCSVTRNIWLPLVVAGILGAILNIRRHAVAALCALQIGMLLAHGVLARATWVDPQFSARGVITRALWMRNRCLRRMFLSMTFREEFITA